MYVLALESVPTLWTDMASTWGHIQSAISRIQTRNPGLEFRTHWITRMSYGRDPYYTPHTNYGQGPTDPIGWAYYYPGTMSSKENLQYYVTHSFRSRIHVDDTLFMNPTSYSLADQFNHAMRYPDEIATYNSYLASNPSHEISYRMFIEDIISNPGNYENAIIMNSHGEMLPLPPVRNYSDPAKDPVGHQNARVVTHAESLFYKMPGPFTLRVYPYTMYPDTTSLTVLDTICVKVIGSVSLTDVEVVVGDSATKYEKRIADNIDEYQVTNWGDSLQVLLFKTPLTHSYNDSTKQGLHPSQRLYGLEYVPCPVESISDFTQDLTKEGADLPKNTARWMINLVANASQELTVETSIGDQIHNHPNISPTYVWMGVLPPVTEIFQIQGDPRHSPYADVKQRGQYNRYFVSVPAGYEGFSDTRSGWETYVNNTVPDNDPDCDVWRLTQLLRTALIKSHCIYLSLPGFTAKYYGLGGEFGGDVGLIATTKLDGTPWSKGGAVIVDEIMDTGADVVKPRVIAAKDLSWISMPWLGELCPDHEFDAHWDSIGNLPTSTYYRAEYEEAGFPYYRSKSLGERGSATFPNATKKSGNFYFMHENADGGKGILAAGGGKLQFWYNVDLPGNYPCPTPFDLDYGSWGRRPINWDDYSPSRCTTQLFTEYYSSSHGGYRASASVFLEKGGDWSYFLLNGGSHADAEGARVLARMMLIEAVDCFMRAGEPYSVQDYRRMRQVPRVEFSSPSSSEEYDNPNHVKIEWTVEWLRWDGEKYTENYSESFSETTEVVVGLKYSDDAGKSWMYLDDTPTEANVRPDASHEFKYQTSYNWDVSGLPKGEYLLRIEGYRTNIEPHYAHHQVLIIIERDAT
jgi:hypothetical protein